MYYFISIILENTKSHLGFVKKGCISFSTFWKNRTTFRLLVHEKFTSKLKNICTKSE